jgi:PAS domain S-box-containing protein
MSGAAKTAGLLPTKPLDSIDFYAVINSIPVPIVVTTETGEVEAANAAILEFFGMTTEQLKGWRSGDWIHPDDLPRAVTKWKQALETGRGYEHESRHRRHDGVFRWIQVRVFPVRDHDGRIARWLLLQTDIHDRKQAEAALSASERKLDLIINTIPALAWSARPDGSADFFNRHYLEYIGLSLDEARDWGWTAAVHPDDLAGVTGAWQSMHASGAPGEAEARLRRHDGEYRWFLFRASPLRDENGQIIKWFGVNTDIGDRKRAEDALAAGETELRRAHEHLTNAQRLSHTGSFTAGVLTDDHIWSDELYRIVEWDPGTRPSFPEFRKLIHPEDFASFDAADQRSLADGADFDQVFRIITPSGTVKHLHTVAHRTEDASGQSVFMGAIQDVTESKVAAEALAASERNLSLIINMMPGLAWSARVDGHIEFLNQNYLDYLGLSPEQARNLFWEYAVHPDDADGITRMGRTAASSGALGEAEARLRRFDGEYRWFVCRAIPLRDQSGQVIRWFGINFDIEDRKRAEEELRSAQARLTEIGRALTMGQLTASIAHEVNQPLSGIITNASTCLRMLAANPPNVEGARETARRTIRDGNRASEVVKRLRALFSRKNASLEPVDLNEAAREVIALSMNALQSNGVTLQVDLAEDLPTASGDRVQLQQVILNLIQNASDAMRSLDGRARAMAVTTIREGGSIRLSVRDAGVGFSPENGERLFDPFYTTKSDGMGIGLSLSRSIIERHGGRMWASLNEGAGTTFSFSVPIVVKDGTAASEPGGMTTAKSTESKSR